MIDEHEPPTEAELREAELLADALDRPQRPGRDVAEVQDALATAWLVRASRAVGLSELRARFVWNRAWRAGRNVPIAARLLAAVAAAVTLFVAVRPHGPARLPAPSPELLRAQLAAARPQADVALDRLQIETRAYREQLFSALRRTYGATR
jgi:hypothetical protein